MKYASNSVLGLAILGGAVSAQTTERVSVSTGGVEANAHSFNVTISADGRYVAFRSDATNLVAGDTNGSPDVFVRDRQVGTTERVNLRDGANLQTNGNCTVVSMSSDARYVAFDSTASDLVAGDTNASTDAFVRDRQTGATERVSVSSSNVQGNASSGAPVISSDGSHVAFISDATNLLGAATDSNGVADIYLRDRVNGATERISIAIGAVEPDSHSYGPSLSADSRYVAFWSYANNLAPGDTNFASDVFVRDRSNATNELVSVAQGGGWAHDSSRYPSISADGRYVVFWSVAPDLVPSDTNGRADVFVRDRRGGTTTRVSLAAGGVEANANSGFASISADGRYAAFFSEASNLVALDSNGRTDTFVADLATGRIDLVSVSTIGLQGNANSDRVPVISADGHYVAFGSSASNLVPGDTNGDLDVFVRDRGGLYPGSYCTAGTTSHGCVASIAAVGTPSASSGSGFTILVSRLEGRRRGLVFYGLDNAGFDATPWRGSTSWLCVKAPTQRTSVQYTGGTASACDGSLALDWNGFIAMYPSALGVPFSAGQHVFAQAWFRDPPSPKTTQLSDALEFVVGP